MTVASTETGTIGRLTPAELVTQAEAARRLGVSRQRVSTLVRNGRAPEPAALVDRGVPVWRPEDVERWAAERAADGGETP